jgi:Zn-dependent protease with chaperone function
MHFARRVDGYTPAMHRFAAGALAISCLVASLAFSTDLTVSKAEVDAQRERLARLGFALMLERQKRLIRVSSRLRIRGAALCGEKLNPVTGIVAATSTELPQAYRETAYRSLGVDDLVKVLWVLPDSPAAEVGLQPGDTILEIDGRETHSAAALDQRTASDAKTFTALKLERAGEILDLHFESRDGCFRPAVLSLLDNIDARAEGSRMIVYSGLLRFAETDDELAIVLAHELAHELLGHRLSTAIGESEADYLGLYLVARAGYDVAAAEALARRFSAEFPLALEERAGHIHPISTARSNALAASLREIEDKLERGEPLEPRKQ